MSSNHITIYYDDECILCKTAVFSLKFQKKYQIEYKDIRIFSDLPDSISMEDGFVIYHDRSYYQGLNGIQQLRILLEQKTIGYRLISILVSIPILGTMTYASMKFLRKILLKIQGKKYL